MESQESIVILKESLSQKMKTFNKIRYGNSEVIQKLEIEKNVESKNNSSLNIANLGTSFFGRRRR